jgi:hypothetical protein
MDFKVTLDVEAKRRVDMALHLWAESLKMAREFLDSRGQKVNAKEPEKSAAR